MRNRHSIYSVEEIIGYIKSGKRRIFLDGESVRVSGVRMKSFAVNGTTCVTCGLTGVFFAMEALDNDKSYHLNLYALDSNGKEVLMTRDHIIPKSKGGGEGIDNMQTMCTRCNCKKADKLPKETP